MEVAENGHMRGEALDLPRGIPRAALYQHMRAIMATIYCLDWKASQTVARKHVLSSLPLLEGYF